MHVAALRNPAMLGGPFIDHEPSRVDEIKMLIDRTTREYAHMLEFAAAVQELDKLLATEAAGLSLEPLYQKIPDCGVQQAGSCLQGKGIESERLYCHKEIVLPAQPVTSRLAAAF
jgi:diiron non-heme beta-hydroxylase-like protein